MKIKKIIFLCFILIFENCNNKYLYKPNPIEIEMDLYLINEFCKNDCDSVSYYFRDNGFINLELLMPNGVEVLLGVYVLDSNVLVYQHRVDDSIKKVYQQKLLNTYFKNIDSILKIKFIKYSILKKYGIKDMVFVKRKNYYFVAVHKENIVYYRTKFKDIDISSLKSTKYQNWYYKIYDNVKK